MEDDKRYTVKGLLRIMKKPRDESKILPQAITIDLNNYKPYNGINELRKKAKEYVKNLKGQEFSLEEKNPHINFTFSNESVWHIVNGAGKTKLIITKQLPEIFKQGIILEVEDEKKKDTNTENVLHCGTYIMLQDELFMFYFTLKLKKGGKNYIYDGNINVDKPEIKKEAD